MLLLLLMYTAPLLALVLGARARAGRPAILASGAEALRDVAAGEAARPVGLVLAGALAVTVACAGAAAGVAFLAGVGVALLPCVPAIRREGPAWTWSTTAASLGSGTFGFLAWFYADPAGAVVLVCFALGLSLAAALAAVATGISAGDDEAPVQAMALHLLAVAATLEIAATAEADALLSLGGLVAEAETLRSELLLLPLAIHFLALPTALVASRASRLASTLPGGPGEARAASLLLLAAVLVLHASCSLAWDLVGCFAAGLLLREAAVFVDRLAAVGGATAGRPSSPGIVAAVLAVGGSAIAAGLGGAYGVALAAIGATATFPVSLAAAWAGPDAAAEASTGRPGAWSEVADTTAAAGAALAAIAASGPAVLAALARAGEAPELSATAPLPLLFSALAGLAVAAGLLDRVAGGVDAGEAARAASTAVAGAAAIPLLGGLLFGPAALAGATVGVVGACLVAGPARPGVGRPAWVACGGTAALSALVAAPIAV